MTRLIGFSMKKNSIQLNLFPFYLFILWDNTILYVDVTCVFVSLGFKINLYNDTYM